MFEPLHPSLQPASEAPAPAPLPSEQRLEAHLLHCAIASLREARECATGEADAPTIYARIDGLLAERRARLEELLRQPGELPTTMHVAAVIPQAPRGRL